MSICDSIKNPFTHITRFDRSFLVLQRISSSLRNQIFLVCSRLVALFVYVLQADPWIQEVLEMQPPNLGLQGHKEVRLNNKYSECYTFDLQIRMMSLLVKIVVLICD